MNQIIHLSPLPNATLHCNGGIFSLIQVEVVGEEAASFQRKFIQGNLWGVDV
jgi:hypothetical protein